MAGLPFTRKKLSYRQLNQAGPADVFPLLCPVREKEWIDGWEYTLVYSVSGVAEKGCVFTTTVDHKTTTWYVTEYDPAAYRISFVRMTPDFMVVQIDISLSEAANGCTQADISYEYTALSAEGMDWIKEQAEAAFKNAMQYWEKAINHYLATGTLLRKTA